MKLCLAMLIIISVASLIEASLISNRSQLCDIVIRGCTDCFPLNASQCHLCDYNFTLTPTYTCDCQEHYFLNQDKSQCLVCMDLFGRYCSGCSSDSPDNSTYCTGCNPGYYWNNQSCCSASIPNCMYCDFDGITCFACQNNTYLIDGVCSSCSIECLVCDPDIKCTKCRDSQTYLTNGTCKFCSESINACRICSDYNSCTQCMSLQYYVWDAKCVLCNNTIQNCYLCSAANYCLQCQQGTLPMLNSSSCASCSNFIPNCLICSSPQTCDKCNQGEQFRDGRCQTSKGQGGEWLIIILCIVGAIILGVAIGCLICRCKKKKAEQSLLDSNSSNRIKSDAGNNQK